jgi:S-DNA-T family DNA segregation ATPase FtsK/SpoIIIE
MKKRKTGTESSTQNQVAGLFLMGLSAILFLAIVSYNPDDPVNLSVVDNPLKLNNWLGPLGAWFAHIVMQWTFGYASLSFPVLLFITGLLFFKKQAFTEHVGLMSKIIVWTLLISVFLAFPDAFKTGGKVIEYYPSGLLGGWMASKFVFYLGRIGSSLLLVIITVIILFVTINTKINSLATAFQDIINSVKEFISEKAELYRLKKAQKLENEKLEESRVQKFEDESVEPELNIQQQHETFSNEQAIDEEKPVEPELNTEDDIEHPEVQEMAEPDESFDFENEEGDFSEKVDFELKEAIQEEELDYDDLVRESISHFKFPSIELLNNPPVNKNAVTREELKANAELLELKLLDYGVKAKVVRVTAGPVITLYELLPAPGVKVSSIVSLENDLALAMEARGIRIIAPIPGKAAVGIEIPNKNPQMVYLKSLIRSEKFNREGFELPLAIGKAINGESFIVDLVKMPHLLIAGATGAGKSVGINTIICSLLYSVDPGKVKFVMVDPKKLELSLYRDMRDHYLLWRPDLDEDVITKPNNAVSMLNTMVLEMERRQERMHKLSVRNIREYNNKLQKNPALYKKTEHQTMPYIVVLIDELADLMMVASKEVEIPIARLAQMARAGGIHMIVATQRPSVDVITGLIKANLPARLAYQVATKVDSRTILDANGADQLLGNGDLLFKLTGTTKPVRLQNPFVATEEVEQIIRHIKKQPKMPYYSLPQPSEARRDSFDDGIGAGQQDELYKDARAIVVRSQQGSISLLQRRLKIGYSRAARLIDEMEEEGVVGASMGGKPREVLMTVQELDAIS